MRTISRIFLVVSLTLALCFSSSPSASADSSYGDFNADGTYSYHGDGHRYGAPQRPMAERDDRFYEERKRYENAQIERQNEALYRKPTSPQAEERQPVYKEQTWIYGRDGRAYLCTPGHGGFTTTCQ